MAAVTALAIGVVAGGIKAYGGYKDKKAAKKKQEAAAAGLAEAKDALKAVDTSNPWENATNKMAGLENKYEGQENVYAGMENKMSGQENAFDGLENKFDGMENAFEDLTVNTQQAEFEAQQNQQNQANIMSSMAGAAGGSGIAALAQSMANAGAMQSQKASASIGAQESENSKKAAQANQDIDMATAQEGSKMQQNQASEQSRLDTQERVAASDIQKTQMGAEEAMQAAELGEASKLQMAEAEGAQALQANKAQGDMWSADAEMSKQNSLMSSSMQEMGMAGAEKAAANESMMSGISGMAGAVGSFSDKRLKKDIVKIKYSDSGIPIYNFSYIGSSQTWSGTMAQDLLRLGREDAVSTKHGYYTVNYNLIDVDMKKVIPSPLKQLGGAPQEEMKRKKDQTDAGLEIIGGGAKRLAWSDMQFDIKDLEPEAMKLRKLKDQILRDKERAKYDSGAQVGLSTAFTKVGFDLVKQYKEELLIALDDDDIEGQGKVKTKLAKLSQTVDIIKEGITEFYDDHFNTETLLSKGNSQQQISFATQIYCENPDLRVVYAVDSDVMSGTVDYYGELVKIEEQYAIVYDFTGKPVLIHVYDGSKGMFIRNNMKATEYITFLNDTFNDAQKALKSKEPVKIDLGRIDYKIDTLFGYNDGTASKEQDELVRMFCHDSEVLSDGSTFRRHLYEHPNIKDLNYGGFDWDKLEDIMPLGPGDSEHWYDEIDEHDKMLLVDALINVDSPYYNIKLLRTLVKEYYTYKLENAWWKGMGFEEGKLDVMRLKREKLNEARFKKDKAAAAGEGRLDFLFDGKVYPTGMTKAKVKEMEDERGKAAEKANPQSNYEK
jgi:hypothetical protein